LIFQPKKKPKGKELSVADHFLNRTIASIKRYRIVKDILRNTKDGFSDLVMGVARALHNWRISFRQPVPSSPSLIAYFR
jgi:hypothetical protein